MKTLLDLNEDILVDDVLPNLSLKDILNLQIVCRDLYQIVQVPAIWYSLHLRLFKTPPILPQQSSTELSYKDAFKARLTAKVYTWGDASGGRLGYLATKIGTGGRAFSSSVPHKIENDETFHIASIFGSGYSFVFFTVEGLVHAIGEVEHPSINNSFFSMRSTFDKTKPKQLYTRDNENAFFSQISTGRECLLAVDKSGTQMYVWDSSFLDVGLLLDFDFNHDKSQLLKIEKVCGGWAYSAALMEDIGVVTWHHDQKFQETKDARVSYSIIPQTSSNSNKILDIASGECFIIMCNEAGELQFADLEEPVPAPAVLEAFSGWLDLQLNREYRPKFVRVFANFRHFAAMTDQEDILFGSSEDLTKIIVHPELQNNIVDLSLGDHHFMALTSSGEILTWGLDLGRKGVFGLGEYNMVNDRMTLSNAPPDTEIESNQKDSRILHPIKIPLKGRALAIAAGGAHSAAIIIGDEA